MDPYMIVIILISIACVIGIYKFIALYRAELDQASKERELKAAEGALLDQTPNRENIYTYIQSLMGIHSLHTFKGAYKEAEILSILESALDCSIKLITVDTSSLPFHVYEIIVNDKQETPMFLHYTSNAAKANEITICYKEEEKIKLSFLEIALSSARIIKESKPIYFVGKYLEERLLLESAAEFPNIVGGTFEDVLDDCKALIRRGGTGVLIHGAHQVGKSTLLNSILYELWNDDTLIIEMSPNLIESSNLRDIEDFVKRRPESKIIFTMGQNFDSFLSSTVRTVQHDLLSEFIAKFSMMKKINKVASWVAATNTDPSRIIPLWSSRFACRVEIRELTNLELEKYITTNMVDTAVMGIIPEGKYSYNDAYAFVDFK